MNQARETRTLQVIPGDILQFLIGQVSPQDMNFTVAYVIEASGELYHPVSQEPFPKEIETGDAWPFSWCRVNGRKMWPVIETFSRVP